jgi:hypothetical protein
VFYLFKRNRSKDDAVKPELPSASRFGKDLPFFLKTTFRAPVPYHQAGNSGPPWERLALSRVGIGCCLTRQSKRFRKTSDRADGPLPAAAYVRMSTDLQKYSTENQLETIRRYAAQRGHTIVNVFEDSGRSGLTIDDRDGLQSLMLKVQSGTAAFQVILVYDVRGRSGNDSALVRHKDSSINN